MVNPHGSAAVTGTGRAGKCTRHTLHANHTRPPRIFHSVQHLHTHSFYNFFNTPTPHLSTALYTNLLITCDQTNHWYEIALLPGWQFFVLFCFSCSDMVRILSLGLLRRVRETTGGIWALGGEKEELTQDGVEQPLQLGDPLPAELLLGWVSSRNIPLFMKKKRLSESPFEVCLPLVFCESSEILGSRRQSFWSYLTWRLKLKEKRKKGRNFRKWSCFLNV